MGNYWENDNSKYNLFVRWFIFYSSCIDSQPHKVRFNGKEDEWFLPEELGSFVPYEYIVMKYNILNRTRYEMLSIVYANADDEKSTGILAPGQSVKLKKSGTSISAYDTSNA